MRRQHAYFIRFYIFRIGPNVEWDEGQDPGSEGHPFLGWTGPFERGINDTPREVNPEPARPLVHHHWRKPIKANQTPGQGGWAAQGLCSHLQYSHISHKTRLCKFQSQSFHHHNNKRVFSVTSWFWSWMSWDHQGSAGWWIIKPGSHLPGPWERWWGRANPGNVCYSRCGGIRAPQLIPINRTISRGKHSWRWALIHLWSTWRLAAKSSVGWTSKLLHTSKDHHVLPWRRVDDLILSPWKDLALSTQWSLVT